MVRRQADAPPVNALLGLRDQRDPHLESAPCGEGWVIERTSLWFAPFRQPSVRYERRPDIPRAFHLLVRECRQENHGVRRAAHERIADRDGIDVMVERSRAVGLDGNGAAPGPGRPVRRVGWWRVPRDRRILVHA